MEITSIIKKIIPVLIVIGIGVVCYAYFFDGYAFPPCCDTAITLIKAQEIAKTWDFSAPMPVNPSDGTPLYSSIISTELPLHLILAVIYSVVPAVVHSLAFAKVFFLVLFLLPIIPLYRIGMTLSNHRLSTIAFILFTYFSFWFGNMYWTGHVAQILGIFVLMWIVYFLLKFDESQKNRFIIGATLLLATLFFVHILTFLVGFLTLFTYCLLYLSQHTFKRRKLILVLLYAVYALGLLFFFHLVPESSRITPGFAVTELSIMYESLKEQAVPLLILSLLFIIGLFEVVRTLKYVVIIFLLSTVLLTQSAELGTPFYAYRFAEFSVLPVAVLMMYGFNFLKQKYPQPIFLNLIAACLIIIILPFGIQTQNDAKKCYVANCTGLHPTQMPASDLNAFEWLGSHADADSIVLAPPKFGYYIPVVSSLSVELPEGVKEKIYTISDAATRHDIAQQYDISYIIWGRIFDEKDGNVLEMEQFSEKEFNNPQYFSIVYESGGTKIYATK